MGCAAPQAPLPTRAVVAIPPTASPVATAPPPTSPPTWTPVAVEQGAVATWEVLPTLTVTPRGFIPTRTPYPPTPTPTPLVTVTPFGIPEIGPLPTRPPTLALGPSKLGIHVVQNNDPAIMEFVRQAKPAVVKGVDDLGFLTEVELVSPWTVTVGRVNDNGTLYAGNPEEEAQNYVARHIDKYLANRAVDYWEGPNEPDPNMEHMGWYARFEQERVRQMARYGLRSAVGGFATGVPELHEFELFVPAIATAKEYNGVLSLHEYSAPTMTYLFGEGLPGYPDYPDRGALTFRYRWYYREILEPAGLVIPLIITEAGVDGIIGGRPGPNGGGWRDFGDYWVQQGWGEDGGTAFLNQLSWYDDGVRQDGYVIGFTVFTAGGIAQWGSYDINPLLPQFTLYVLSQK